MCIGAAVCIGVLVCVGLPVCVGLLAHAGLTCEDWGGAHSVYMPLNMFSWITIGWFVRHIMKNIQ